jgi:hypothetical protein
MKPEIRPGTDMGLSVLRPSDVEEAIATLSTTTVPGVKPN